MLRATPAAAARRPGAARPPGPARAPSAPRRPVAAAAASAPPPPGPGEAGRGPRPAGGVDAPSASAATTPALATLPVITLPRVLLPASRGAARLYEPRLVAALAAALASADGRFVHAPSQGAGPPGRAAGPGGLPRVATLARATRTTSIAGGGRGGEVLVEYEGLGRVTVLDAGNAGRGPGLYATATVAPLSDAPPPDARSAAAAASLELDLAAALAAVDRLTPRGPGEGPGSRLPPGVAEHAPPPPPPPEPAQPGGTVAAGLRASGHDAAARAVAAWARQGAAASPAPPPPADPLLAAAAADAGRAPGNPAAPPGNPYALAAARVGEAVAGSPSSRRRRELFSFAAADALALGPVEAVALCEVTDTAARLAFVLEAVRAHLADLAARAALRGAVEGGGGEE